LTIGDEGISDILSNISASDVVRQAASENWHNAANVRLNLGVACYDHLNFDGSASLAPLIASVGLSNVRLLDAERHKQCRNGIAAVVTCSLIPELNKSIVLYSNVQCGQKCGNTTHI